MKEELKQYLKENLEKSNNRKKFFKNRKKLFFDYF